MTTLKLITYIAAPIERCFNLSRSIDLHVISTKATGERAIAGRTSGLIMEGETVTWEAVHFGIKQRLTTRIAMMRPPYYFSDEQVAGAFKSMYHEHHFESNGSDTVITDTFTYETPYGIFGKLFDVLVLKAYMRRFLWERNSIIKRIAEGTAWEGLLGKTAG